MYVCVCARAFLCVFTGTLRYLLHRCTQAMLLLLPAEAVGRHLHDT
jgi:hypothetical protein